MKEKDSKANYLAYAIALVILLIIATLAITFAYYNVNTTSNKTLVDVSASLDCIDLKLSNSGSNIKLSYNYPITDELASQSGSITPVTVSVTNNCSSTKKYTLALSTLSLTNSTSSYIEDSKIRLKVTKNNTSFLNASYLNRLSTISTTNQAYADLTGTSGELATKYPNYTLKNIYAIENVRSIEPNETNTYSVYLWVDYYEGDSAMYSSATAIHDESYDGTTENKKFAAAISLSLNRDDEISQVYLAEQLINTVSSDMLWDSPLEDDGYRYVGTDPDNYICFGTTDKDTCVNDTDKYMYRMIGMFEDESGNKHTKLIKKESLNNTYVWNNDSYTNVDWNNSDLYKGINGEYFLTNTEYSYMQDSAWTSKIATWNYTMTNTKTYENYNSNSIYGPYYNDNTGKAMYLHELNRNSKSNEICYYNYGSSPADADCNVGDWKNLSTKISLMYASDYALSLGEEALNYVGVSENYILSTGWMHLGDDEWTMSRMGYDGDYYYAWYVYIDGDVYVEDVGYWRAVRPVFYLASDVEILGGTGSESDPYLIR